MADSREPEKHHQADDHGHSHEHEHRHSHGHDLDHHEHEHNHEHGHSHEHTHRHAHGHEHGGGHHNGSDHDHAHEHGGAHVHSHGEDAASGAALPEDFKKTAALLDYMVNHNRDHAGELADMAKKLRQAEFYGAAELVEEGVRHFEEGNGVLAKALEKIKGGNR